MPPESGSDDKLLAQWLDAVNRLLDVPTDYLWVAADSFGSQDYAHIVQPLLRNGYWSNDKVVSRRTIEQTGVDVRDIWQRAIAHRRDSNSPFELWTGDTATEKPPAKDEAIEAVTDAMIHGDFSQAKVTCGPENNPPESLARGRIVIDIEVPRRQANEAPDLAARSPEADLFAPHESAHGEADPAAAIDRLQVADDEDRAQAWVEYLNLSMRVGHRNLYAYMEKVGNATTFYMQKQPDLDNKPHLVYRAERASVSHPWELADGDKKSPSDLPSWIAAWPPTPGKPWRAVSKGHIWDFEAPPKYDREEEKWMQVRGDFCYVGKVSDSIGGPTALAEHTADGWVMRGDQPAYPKVASESPLKRDLRALKTIPRKRALEMIEKAAKHYYGYFTTHYDWELVGCNYCGAVTDDEDHGPEHIVHEQDCTHLWAKQIWDSLPKEHKE